MNRTVTKVYIPKYHIEGTLQMPQYFVYGAIVTIHTAFLSSIAQYHLLLSCLLALKVADIILIIARRTATSSTTINNVP